MTAYIMRFYKKISLLALLLICLTAWAHDSQLKITSASLNRHDAYYALDANFNADIAPLLKDAVTKGLPLSFLVEFELVEPRKYWFDHEVQSASTRINIHYHALTKQYLVSQGEQQKSYATLNEAIAAMGQITRWDVVKTNVVELGAAYQATLTISLDKSQLPKAIQVDAISSEDWSVTSPEYTWNVNLTP